MSFADECRDLKYKNAHPEIEQQQNMLNVAYSCSTQIKYIIKEMLECDPHCRDGYVHFYFLLNQGIQEDGEPNRLEATTRCRVIRKGHLIHSGKKYVRITTTITPYILDLHAKIRGLLAKDAIKISAPFIGKVIDKYGYKNKDLDSGSTTVISKVKKYPWESIEYDCWIDSYGEISYSDLEGCIYIEVTYQV